MRQPEVKHKYTGYMTRPKKSILRRWAFTNAVFFFVVFFLFAVIIYLITISSFISGEKNTMISSMNTIEEQLKKADQPLTTNNLHHYFDYYPSTDGQTIETPRTITSMIGAKNQLFLYDTKERLIFSTAGNSFPFFKNTKGTVQIVTAGSYKGYLKSRPIVSKKTGKVIGYIQSFYNLNAYFQLQRKLILSLTIVAVVVIVAAMIFGYVMADYFLRPLRRLSDSMEKVASNPEEVFEPVIMSQDDEIKQIGDFYNQMMSQINVNLEHQKRFVSDVSHELRTPLAVIDGNLNMLLRWGFDDHSLVEENVRIAHEEAVRMNAMLKDMLDLSRLESLSENYHSEVCDVVHVVSDLVRNFQMIHEDFKISFENKLSNANWAKISENHYTQMIMILMENAVKYSTENRKTIQLKLENDENFIITSVSDQGVGISKEDAGHVFERFFRADKARNREIGGTGLGLSILSNILKFYQGEITMDSELGIGTTFTFKIPKVAEENT